MNQGLPNYSKALSKTLLLAGGFSGIGGWILAQILEYVLKRGSKQALAYMDKGHMILVVNNGKENFDQVGDTQWAIADQGKVLTKEEANAINDPFINSLIEFGTFNKLRGNTIQD